MSDSNLPPAPHSDPDREAALQRVKAKRAFQATLAVYAIVNIFLWVLWALTKDTGGSSGAPWPIWVTVGWGVGIAFQAWGAYGRSRPITEDEVQREMGRDR